MGGGGGYQKVDRLMIDTTTSSSSCSSVTPASGSLACCFDSQTTPTLKAISRLSVLTSWVTPQFFVFFSRWVISFPSHASQKLTLPLLPRKSEPSSLMERRSNSRSYVISFLRISNAYTSLLRLDWLVVFSGILPDKSALEPSLRPTTVVPMESALSTMSPIWTLSTT